MRGKEKRCAYFESSLPAATLRRPFFPDASFSRHPPNVFDGKQVQGSKAKAKGMANVRSSNKGKGRGSLTGCILEDDDKLLVRRSFSAFVQAVWAEIQKNVPKVDVLSRRQVRSRYSSHGMCSPSRGKHSDSVKA